MSILKFWRAYKSSYKWTSIILNLYTSAFSLEIKECWILYPCYFRKKKQIHINSTDSSHLCRRLWSLGRTKQHVAIPCVIANWFAEKQQIIFTVASIDLRWPATVDVAFAMHVYVCDGKRISDNFYMKYDCHYNQHYIKQTKYCWHNRVQIILDIIPYSSKQNSRCIARKMLFCFQTNWVIYCYAAKYTWCYIPVAIMREVTFKLPTLHLCICLIWFRNISISSYFSRIFESDKSKMLQQEASHFYS